jgi:hypothetical protein
MLRIPLFREFIELTAREKRRLLDEISHVQGLMPLLMKRRNGQKWTREERRELRSHLVRLSELSHYLILLVMPGGFVLLPVLAWWLDRRRKPRGVSTSRADSPSAS